MLLSTGHRKVLGSPSAELWSVLAEHYHITCPGADSVPISLYGDEIQIFDGHQCMALNWMSEACPHHTMSSASRFLIALIPSNRYHMVGKVNATLQACLAIVAESCNKLRHEGVQGFKTVVSSIRGDWKFLCQALSLKHTPSSNCICFKCPASKDMQCPFSDVSATAEWRDAQLAPESVWHAQPALVALHEFSLDLVSLDILHCYHLGMGRDIIASTIVLLLRTQHFPGRYVPWFES